jgi:hypothetical protein
VDLGDGSVTLPPCANWAVQLARSVRRSVSSAATLARSTRRRYRLCLRLSGKSAAAISLSPGLVAHARVARRLGVASGPHGSEAVVVEL